MLPEIFTDFTSNAELEIGLFLCYTILAEIFEQYLKHN